MAKKQAKRRRSTSQTVMLIIGVLIILAMILPSVLTFIQ